MLPLRPAGVRVTFIMIAVHVILPHDMITEMNQNFTDLNRAIL
jgi:hypothetical protein